MEVPQLVDDVLGYGLKFAEAGWLALPALCLAGLVFMVAGHRLAVPGQMLINRTFFYIMAAVLIGSLIFVVLEFYAISMDRYYGYGLIMYFFMMVPSVALSVIGVLLYLYSRFPIPRA